MILDGFQLQHVRVGQVRLRGSPEAMGDENHADYHRAIHDPETVHAMVEDYRAGLTVDRAADDADRASGRRISCPTLFLWSTNDGLDDLYDDPLTIWRDWAPDVRGLAIPSSHHMAEESPDEVAAAINRFLEVSLDPDIRT